MPGHEGIYTGLPAWRSMFFKLVPTFVLVGFAAMVLSAVLTSVLWRHRAQEDIRALPGRLHPAVLATLIGSRDLRDPVQCRQAADALFWHVVRQGLDTVMDFGPMLGYFADGRLQVRISGPAGEACATAPAATPLLVTAYAEADSQAGRGPIRREGDWADVVRIALPGGADARIGMHYRSDWQLHHEVIDSTGYEVLRTTLYLVVMGGSFSALLVWLLVRRLRRMASVAQSWAAGDLSVRIGDGKRDELGVLSARFDQMANELERVMDMRRELAVSIERARVARDLHDTAKQRCFVLGLKLTELAHAAEHDPPCAAAVAQARQMAQHLQQDLEHVVQGFSAPVVMQSGLRATIGQWVSQCLSGQGIDWRVDLPDVLCRMLEARPDMARELVLITQEAVANALRHSGGERVTVACEAGSEEASWVWSVRDDGRGIDLASVRKGMGLDNLRWRATQLPGGWLQLASDERGTRVSVHFTLSERS